MSKTKTMPPSHATVLLMSLNQHIFHELKKYKEDLDAMPVSDQENRRILLVEHENAMRTLRMAVDAVTNAKAMFFGL